MEEILETNGCLGDGATDKDRVLSGEMLEKLPELDIQNQIIFEYNQGNSNDCTIYSALGACSDLLDIEITPEQIEEANEESYKRGRVRGQGRFTQNAVNLACDMIYKWFGIKLAYYRIPNWFDDQIEMAIVKNYSLCSSFNGNSEYQKDRIDNGKIDESHKGPFTYGHAICIIKRDGKKFVKDNYKGRKENGRFTNIYEIIPKISKLKYDGCWQNYSYLIVRVKDEKEEDMKRLNQMKNLIDKIGEYSGILIPANSEMRENTHDEEYQKQLHLVNEALRKLQEMNIKKKKDIEKELSKYFV